MDQNNPHHHHRQIPRKLTVGQSLFINFERTSETYHRATERCIAAYIAWSSAFQNSASTSLSVSTNQYQKATSAIVLLSRPRGSWKYWRTRFKNRRLPTYHPMKINTGVPAAKFSFDGNADSLKVTPNTAIMQVPLAIDQSSNHFLRTIARLRSILCRITATANCLFTILRLGCAVDYYPAPFIYGEKIWMKRHENEPRLPN